MIHYWLEIPLSHLSIPQRYVINILAVARRGHQLKQRFIRFRFVAGVFY